MYRNRSSLNKEYNFKLNSVTASAKSIILGRYDQISGCQSEDWQLHFGSSEDNLYLIRLYKERITKNNNKLICLSNLISESKTIPTFFTEGFT